MLPKGFFTILLLTTVLLWIVDAVQLPSCERASCYHCKVSFIARKCPEKCSKCGKHYVFPEQKRIRRPTYVVAAQQIHELIDGKSGLLRPISQPESHFQASAQQQQQQKQQQHQQQQIEPKLSSQQPQQTITNPEWKPTLATSPNSQTIQFKLKAVYENANTGIAQQQEPTVIQGIVQSSPVIQDAPSAQSQVPAPIPIPVPSPTTNPNQVSPPQLTLPQPQQPPQPYFPQPRTLQIPQPSTSPSLQQSQAFNPFQPFLTQTFNAVPGTNLQPLFLNPYTPFPLPTFPPMTSSSPLQPPSGQSIYQPYQQQPQSQYVQYPINEGHPSVNVKQLAQTVPTDQAQKSQQFSQTVKNETTKKNTANAAQNNTPQQETDASQTKPQQSQAQTSIPAAINQTPVNIPIINPPTLLPLELPLIQPSIDAPTITIQKSIYENVKPPSQQQCPRQPNWQPCISKELANERFRSCCLPLGEGCSSLCNYDATLTTIQLSVLTGRCPISKVGDMMVCASGNEDATPCCQAHNVFEPGFEQCRPYCNPSAGLPQGGLLTEKYKCLGKLSQIQHCFYITQKP